MFLSNFIANVHQTLEHQFQLFRWIPWADAPLCHPAHNCGRRFLVVLVCRKVRQHPSYLILGRCRELGHIRDGFDDERTLPRSPARARRAMLLSLLLLVLGILRSASCLSCQPSRTSGTEPESQNIATSC